MRATKLMIGIGLVARALSCFAQADAADVIRVPAISPDKMQRAFQEIYATPPTLPLVAKSAQAHRGDVWLRSTEDGLHIWGKVIVGEQEIRWPQQKSEMLSSDHIEVWLAASINPVLPSTGWGNQFGMAELKSAQDCMAETDARTADAASRAKNCQRWYEEQLRYRQQFRRLFTRQWLITASTSKGPAIRSFEEFASSAYANLETSLFPEDLPTLLKPKSDDHLAVEMADDVRPATRKAPGGREYQYYRPIGYRFHVFIPYTAFPPVEQLKLSDLYLAVEVFSSALEGQKQGAYSTTAPNRHWGEPATFNHIRLDSPRVYAITPCEFKLEQQDLYGNNYPAWFFPPRPADSNLSSTFALINPEQGYLYEPGGVSPEVEQAKYFWKPLPDGATACGPLLAWRKADKIRHTDSTIEQDFASTRLPDGWTLLRSGPSQSTLSRFGSGQCGACPVMDFAVYAVSPEGDITQALAIQETLSPPESAAEADMTIAPDWSKIILYLLGASPEEQSRTTGWTSTAYCLEGHVYKKCGEAKNVQPPDPPHFKEFRGPE